MQTITQGFVGLVREREGYSPIQSSKGISTWDMVLGGVGSYQLFNPKHQGPLLCFSCVKA